MSLALSGRKYAGESLENRQLRRRQQFMQAGLHLFGTQGYRKTTVRMLCAEAGLTDRYFYESFESTEDLLVAVYEAQIEQVQHAVVQAVANEQFAQTPMLAIKTALHAVFSLTAQPGWGRVFWMEVLGVSPRVDAVYVRTFNLFTDLVLMLTRHFYPNLTISGDEERVVGMALIGAVGQSATYWMLGGYQQPLDTLVSGNARIFEGLVKTLVPDAGV